MIFFSVKKKITIQFQSQKIIFQPPPGRGSSVFDYPNRIYCCTTADIISIGRIFESMSCKDDLQIIPESEIKSRSDFPIQLGAKNDGEWERNLYYSGLIKTISEDFINIKIVDIDKQILSLKKIKTPRIAILNGFGSGIGDTLIGITAFLNAYEKIKKTINPVIEIIYSPKQHKNLAPVFQYTTFIDKFHIAPITLKNLLKFDAIFDTGGMAHRTEFYNIPVIDIFLMSFGLNPDLIHNNKKRNTLMNFLPGNNIKNCIQKIRDNNPEKKILLLHSKTSSIFKDIPDFYLDIIIHKIETTDKYIILTDEAISTSTSPAVIDLSRHAKSFSALCDIISQVDGILTADTCVYHIADCFNIPTVTWFTIFDPDIWARYYPGVKGILLGEKSGFLNQKPEDTEDNLRKLNKLWEETDIDESLLLLESAMEDKHNYDIPENGKSATLN